MKDYQTKTEVQIRFRDLDGLNHVNNAVFLSWMELGRMALTKKVLPDIDWNELGFILAHITIDYVEPVFLSDKVMVYMKVGRIGGKSITFEGLITKQDAKGERQAAKGTNVIVAYDFKQNRSMEIPDYWREGLKFNGSKD